MEYGGYAYKQTKNRAYNKEFSEMKEKSKVNLIQASSQSQALVEEMKDMAGTYESLFSRRAMKYRSMGLNEKTLTEFFTSGLFGITLPVLQ